MQYVTHDGFTQKSAISVSCPGPVGNNGGSKFVLHASDDFVYLVLWNGAPFNDERIFQFLQRVVSMSETCSIGARSGERLGQGNVLTLLVCRKFMERRTMCGRALSC